MEVLKLLLDVFDQPGLAMAPRGLCEELPRFSTFIAIDGLPFWHSDCFPEFISPIVFALGSREALSLMLNHGYKPDRSTMRAAINDFDLDIIQALVKSPRLSGRPDRMKGSLSYAVKRKRDDWESARNPLQSAVDNSDLFMIDLLLTYGADVNNPAATHHGATALQLAAIAGKLGILRTLIDHGADIDAAGAEFGGRTALEGAAEHGRIDIIQYLLSVGARTTGRDRLQYLRAIRYAKKESHEVAANLLRRHRVWTTDDHILWTALEGLNYVDLAEFKEKTQEVSSSSNLSDGYMALKETDEVQNELTEDGPDHLGAQEDVFDPIEGIEPPDDLQDLEMRTNNPFIFMTGEM